MSKLALSFDKLKPFYTRHLLLSQIVSSDVSLEILRLAFFLKREEAFRTYERRQLKMTTPQSEEACLTLLCNLEDCQINGIVLYMMGQFYRGRDRENCYKEARRIFTTRCSTGEELFYRGLLALRERERPFIKPENTERDDDEDRQILMYFREAAALGYTEAYVYIGDAFFRGNGVERDLTIALDYYEKGASANSVRAIIDLATILRYSLGMCSRKARSIDPNV